MRRALTILMCLGISLIGYKAMVGPLLGQVLNSDSQPTRGELEAAKIQDKQAKAIIDRHRQELLKVPGVNAVAPVPINGKLFIEVFIYTNAKGERPTSLPSEIAALPPAVEGLPLDIKPVYVLPPPSGVIVLQPGGKKEQLDACPSEYRETKSYGWRFCIHEAHPEPIPGPLMSPPINGIPYETALEIMTRHQAELSALPGVHGVGMGANGIYIEADNPSILPKEIEGLPLEVHPWRGPGKTTNHSRSSSLRPVGGALGIAVGSSSSSVGGTLAAAAFDCGIWLIFPAHVIPGCNSSPPCSSALSGCENRYASTNRLLFQPSGATAKIGEVVRWTPIVENGDSLDAAAAWLDSDINQGNSSVCVDRRIENWGNWTGEEMIPVVGSGVLISSSRTRPSGTSHIFAGSVQATEWREPNIDVGCITVCTPNYNCPAANFIRQIYLTTSETIINGDSGSPIITGDGKIVGMFTWQAPGGTVNRGGGPMARHIRTTLGFSKWYGTTTFPNHSQVCQ